MLTQIQGPLLLSRLEFYFCDGYEKWSKKHQQNSLINLQETGLQFFSLHQLKCVSKILSADRSNKSQFKSWTVNVAEKLDLFPLWKHPSPRNTDTSLKTRLLLARKHYPPVHLSKQLKSVQLAGNNLSSIKCSYVEKKSIHFKPKEKCLVGGFKTWIGFIKPLMKCNSP